MNLNMARALAHFLQVLINNFGQPVGLDILSAFTQLVSELVSPQVVLDPAPWAFDTGDDNAPPL